MNKIFSQFFFMKIFCMNAYNISEYKDVASQETQTNFLNDMK